MIDRIHLIGGLLFLAVAVLGAFLPFWLVSLLTIAFANALVVLGLIILWRARRSTSPSAPTRWRSSCARPGSGMHS